MCSALAIRPLTVEDLPRLSQIRPTYRADTILRVRQAGGLDPANQWGRYSWQLIEQPIDPPYDRGAGYNFFPNVVHQIGERLTRPQTSSVLVAEDSARNRLAGLLEIEYFDWNATVSLTRLMIDLDYRRIGLGTQFWQRTIAFGMVYGAYAIDVETQNTNVPACRFYEKMGCILSGLHTNRYDPATFATAEPEFALFWTFKLV